MRIHCLSSFVFLFGFSLIFAQTSLVGKVFSVDGDPVNGVEVHNLSRKTMVRTSQDGSFSIDVSLNDDSIISTVYVSPVSNMKSFDYCLVIGKEESK